MLKQHTPLPLADPKRQRRRHLHPLRRPLRRSRGRGGGGGGRGRGWERQAQRRRVRCEFLRAYEHPCQIAPGPLVLSPALVLVLVLVLAARKDGTEDDMRPRSRRLFQQLLALREVFLSRQTCL